MQPTSSAFTEARHPASHALTALQIMHGLPRIAGGPDLSDYALMKCPSQPSNDTCTMDPDMNSGSSTSLMEYATSVGAYVVIAAAIAILAPLFGILWCIFRYCMCCCGCCKFCQGGCCGKRYPTEKTKFWGFTVGGSHFQGSVLPDGVSEHEKDLNDMDEPRPAQPAYSMVSRWGARGFMWAYLLLVFVFIMVGHFKGSVGFTTAMKSFVKAPTGLMTTARSLESPMSNMVVNVAGRTLRPFLVDFNGTIAEAVDLTVVSSNIRCVSTSLQNSLPRPQVMRANIARMEASASNVSGAVNATNAAVHSLLGAFEPVHWKAGNLTGPLTDWITDAGGLVVNTTAYDEGMGQVETPYNKVMDGNTGAQATAQNLTNLPSNADATALHTAVDGAYTNPNAAQPAPDTARLSSAAQLAALRNKLVPMPSAGTLADQVQAMRDAADDLAIAIVAVQFAGDALQSASASKTWTAERAAPVLDATQEVAYHNNLNFLGIRESMNSLTGSLDAVPSMSIFTDELARMRGIETIASCARTLLHELRGLNDTVVELPDVFGQIDSTIDEANTTAQDALAQVESFKNTSDSLRAQVLNSLDNMNEYLDQVVEAERQTGASNMTFNRNGTDTANNALNSVLSAWNSTWTSFRSDLDTWKAQVATFTTAMSDSDVSAIRGMNTTLTPLQAAIVAGTLRYTDWATHGFCNDAGTSACTSDSDCSGFSCSVGFSGVCIVSHGTACSSDADCPSSRCLLPDGTDMAGLRTALDDYANAAVPSSISTTATQTQQLYSATSSVDVPGEATTAANMSTKARGLASHLQDAIIDVAKVYAKSSPGAISADALLGDNGAVTSDTSAFDFSALSDQVSALDGAVNATQDMRERADNAASAVDLLDSWMKVGLVRTVGELQVSTLEAVLRDGGLPGLLSHTGRSLDGMIDDVNGIWTGLAGGDALVESGLVGRMLNDTIMSKVRTFTNPALADFGPYWYFANLAGMESDFVNPDDAKPGATLLADENGNAWPSDKKCVSLDCLEATVDDLNTKPLSQSVTLKQAGVDVPVGLSREQVLSVPFLFPSLLIAIGLAATLCACKSFPFVGSPASALSLCGCACSCCHIFFIFLLIGGALFPVVMVFADGCASYPNIAAEYVQGSAPGLCHQMGGEHDYNTGVCNMDVYDGNTAQLSLPEMARSVLGSCTSPDGAAWGSAFSSLGDAVDQVPATYVNNTIRDGQGKPGAIKPALAADMRAAAAAAGRTAVSAVNDVGSVMGCAALNDNGFAPFRDSLCCDTGSALYWSVAAWYMIGWCTCVCGWLASVLGVKRFPSGVWGPQAEEAKNRLHRARGSNEENAIEVELASVPPASVTPRSGGHYSMQSPLAQKTTGALV